MLFAEIIPSLNPRSIFVSVVIEPLDMLSLWYVGVRDKIFMTFQKIDNCL